MAVSGYPPGTCPVCLTPMDPALRDAGDKAHPLCAHPERRRAERCEFAGCELPAWKWPHGDYDLGHARMMAHPRQWPALGIPVVTDELAPRRAARAATAVRAALTDLEGAIADE